MPAFSPFLLLLLVLLTGHGCTGPNDVAPMDMPGSAGDMGAQTDLLPDPNAAVFAAVDMQLVELMHKLPGINASYGVIAGIIYHGETRIFGYGAFALDKVAAPGDLILGIGSNTKVLTATLLAQMVVTGQAAHNVPGHAVALEDPLEIYIPVKLQQVGGPIRLRNLADYGSGLPQDNVCSATMPCPPTATFTALWDWLSTWTPPYAPDSAYAYSNLGFDLLGIALSQAAVGDTVSYEALVVDRIARPLRMTSTVLTLTDALKSRVPTSFDTNGMAHLPTSPSTVHQGGGAFYSSANDMLKFLAAELATEAGSGTDPLSQAMQLTQQPELAYSPGAMPAPADPTSARATCLGWFTDKNTGALTKNGSKFGYTSAMGLIKAKQVAIVLLHNSAEVQGKVDSSNVLTGGANQILTYLAQQ